MKALFKLTARLCSSLALTLVAIPSGFGAVDMNFTHGLDIYTYGQPPGPDAIINPDAYLRTHTLQGTQTRRSEWLQMNVTNYYAHREGFGGGAWQLGALPPNTTYFTSGTSARLYKGSLSNPNAGTIGGNPAGGAGIYSGMNRVSFLLWEESPVADLSTVIFQAYLTTGSEPGFVTNPYQDVNGDFHVTPTLTLFFADGTTRQLSTQESTAELYESRATLFDHIPVEEGSDESIEMYIYENYRSYRWDLNNSGLVSSDIVRFGIEFTIEAHLSLRSISLDQAGGVVPEPADDRPVSWSCSHSGYPVAPPQISVAAVLQTRKSNTLHKNENSTHTHTATCGVYRRQYGIAVRTERTAHGHSGHYANRRQLRCWLQL